MPLPSDFPESVLGCPKGADCRSGGPVVRGKSPRHGLQTACGISYLCMESFLSTRDTVQSRNHRHRDSSQKSPYLLPHQESTYALTRPRGYPIYHLLPSTCGRREWTTTFESMWVAANMAPVPKASKSIDWTFWKIRIRLTEVTIVGHSFGAATTVGNGHFTAWT